MEDKIGSLTPGKQADLAIINTDGLTMVGWNQLDPIGSVVMQAHARDVDTVIVGGKVVKREVVCWPMWEKRRPCFWRPVSAFPKRYLTLAVILCTRS